MSARQGLGTCFGFEVDSDLPFAYLRGGTGTALPVSTPSRPADATDELIAEWEPTPEVPLAGRLHRAPVGYRVWLGDGGWYEVDPDSPSIRVPEDTDPVRREERLWGVPSMLCFLARGDLPLHASAVDIDGGAVVLGAPRAFGKTTLGAAFHVAGHRLLSEDVTCVRPGEAPSIIPGPAMLRLRPDVAARLHVADAAVVSETDDRLHLAIDPSRRGDCEPVPLRGIFLLRANDDLRVERVNAADAIRDLWPLASRFPSRRGVARCFEDLVDVVSRVPVWNLHRPLQFEQLESTTRLIRETVGL